MLLAGVVACVANAACGEGTLGPQDDLGGSTGGQGDGGGPGGSSDGASLGDAPIGPPVAGELLVCPGFFATIGEAIAAAPRGGAIAVCAGTYSEPLLIEDKPLRIRSIEGAATTILDVAGAGTAVVIRATGDPGVTLAGLTIRGGDAPGPAGVGGGVRCEASSLTIQTMVLTANAAGAAGGGLHATGCALTVADSEITANTSRHGGGLHVTDGTGSIIRNQITANVASLQGGGIYLASDALVADNQIIDNTSGWTAGGLFVQEHAPTIRGNTVRGSHSIDDGGGIYVHMSTATFLDNVIAGNTADGDAGGIRAFTSALTLEGNLIEDNTAGGDGGGMKISHVACTLVSNTIRNNVAAGRGGGLELDNDSSVVRGGVISGNRAWRGGGIHASLFPWRGGTIEDVEITGNAADRGGGLDVEDNYQPITMRRLNVAGNTAARGAGIYVRGTTLALSHSLFSGNTAADNGGGILVRARTATTASGCTPGPCPPDPSVTTLEFVVIHGNEAPEGAGLQTDSPSLTVSSSILSANRGGASVTVVGPAPFPDRIVVPTWRYNNTTPATFEGMAAPTGDGNLSADPTFMGVGDFHLADASPCKHAGDPAFTNTDGSRADMGQYGGAR